MRVSIIGLYACLVIALSHSIIAFGEDSSSKIELGNLPNELILKVCTYLPVNELCKFQSVSRRYLEIGSQDLRWKDACIRSLVFQLENLQSGDQVPPSFIQNALEEINYPQNQLVPFDWRLLSVKLSKWTCNRHKFLELVHPEVSPFAIVLAILSSTNLYDESREAGYRMLCTFGLILTFPVITERQVHVLISDHFPELVQRRSNVLTAGVLIAVHVPFYTICAAACTLSIPVVACVSIWEKGRAEVEEVQFAEFRKEALEELIEFLMDSGLDQCVEVLTYNKAASA